MKKCSRCGELKPENEFYKDKRASDGLTSECKACRYVWQKEYNKGRSEVLAKYVKKHQQKKKLELYELKSPCVKCGEDRLYIIDFHHIDPSVKSFGISTKYVTKAEILIEEIKKCVCLCKNCHYEFHHLYGRTPEKPVESLTEYLGRNPYEI